MDAYQPIYDAVRSRISNGDIGAAVEQAMRDANFAHHAEMAANAVHCAAAEYERPSVVFRPKVYVNGNQWCALYGDDLQDGVAGFGDSPAKAMWDFDRNWQKDLTPNAALTGAEGVRVEGTVRAHVLRRKNMEKTFQDFMTRRYAEAEEYATGVTDAQEDIARDAWECATKAAYLKIAADYRKVEGERFSGADVAIWCECEADAL